MNTKEAISETFVVPADGPEVLRSILPVAEETMQRFGAYVALLRRWQRAHNLVSDATLDKVWSRHVADSAQAFAALPDARRWLDLGSGAGFPGLVTAILLTDRGYSGENAHVDLVDGTQRKAAFLRTVIRELDLPASVHGARIETVVPRFAGAVEAVSARALAPLSRLLDLAAPVLEAGAIGVFHKGRGFASEHAEASRTWNYDLDQRRSLVEPDASLVLIRRLARRGGQEIPS